MDEFSLKDYRASHFLMRFIKSQVQGWYVRENILIKLNHPDANAENLSTLKQLINMANGWAEEVQQGKPVFIRENGTIVQYEHVENVLKILRLLFRQYIEMNDRLNTILDDDTPLHERRQDVQYIIACLGWEYYAVNHQVRDDNDFAERFNDVELLEYRRGEAELSEKQVDFVNAQLFYCKGGEIYNPVTSSALPSLVEELLNGNMRDYAGAADKYLTILERQMSRSDSGG